MSDNETITLHLPKSVTNGDLVGLADNLDCHLRQRPDGSYLAVPRNAQGNSHCVKVPRYRKQFLHAALPTAPEPA